MKQEVKETVLFVECPYGKTITFRRSGLSKSAWEYVVHKFGIIDREPEHVKSITIEGTDDYGHLDLTVVAD